jgi:hypothetical protein
MATLYANQYRSVGPRLQRCIGSAFAGEAVRFVGTDYLRNIATAALPPTSFRLIPCGEFTGKVVAELPDEVLERMAEQVSDGVRDGFAKPAAAAALSDEAWLQKEARVELQRRARELALSELANRREPVVRAKPEQYGP